MMEDSLTKEGRTLGRTRTITHLLQIIINVRLQSKYQPNVHFILLKRKKSTYQQTYILLKKLVKKLCKHQLLLCDEREMGRKVVR